MVHQRSACTQAVNCLGKIKKKRSRKRRRHYKTGVHISPKGGECKYRSGWELEYMQYLDASDLVTSYQYEQVIVAYISNVRSGKLRKYWPDFLVEYADGKKCLVEIKPKRKLDNAIVKKKLAAATQWCSEHGVTLEIVTEVELKALGLLK
jgi:hypothetical protein